VGPRWGDSLYSTQPSLQVIRGYVVKIFRDVFSPPSSPRWALHGNRTSGLRPCSGQAGPALSSSAYHAAIIIGLVRLLASLSLSSLLVKFRRRHLYLVSAVTTVCGLVLFATTLLLTQHYSDWGLEGLKTIIDWSSVVFACVLVFSVNLGVQPMANLMTSELFPAEVRAPCKV
jgi:hypothetical protein